MQERAQDEWVTEPTPAEAGAPQGAPAPTPPPDGEGAATPPASEPQAPAMPDDGGAGDEHAAALSERDAYLDALQRLKAEFDNYRKRTERERQAAAASAGRDVLKDLLPVMDNLERALAALEGQDAGVVAGVEIVRDQLAGVLAGRGMSEIEADERQPFDPTVHEAIVSSPAPGFPEGTVVAVIEKGYRLNDQVVRPAKVVVAAGSERGG